jgi:phosphatidylethanolamine N-methyltransferase
MLSLVIVYSLVLSLLPTMSSQAIIALHFAHACAWCIFHCFGLGLVLRAQSESKFIVGHFLKNYHYCPNDGGNGAIQEAFTNWKSLYNLSLCMTYSVS